MASALLGVRRGFLVGASEVLALAVGLFAAWAAYRPVGAAVAAARHMPPGLAALGTFVGLWLIVQMVLGLAFRLALRRVPKNTMRGRANRAWGIFPGLVEGGMAAALLVTLLTYSRSGTAAADVRRSRFGPPLTVETTRGIAVVADNFKDGIRDLQAKLKINTEVEGGRALDFHTTDVQTDPDAEAQMLILLNKERAAEGLQPLAMDRKLREVARQHSKDMLAKGYFAHETPSGASPFDRMHAAGITYALAGENLALALTVDVAHDGLMHSPGHRENILTPGFHHVGIGAIQAGSHGTMFTQDFTN